MAAMPPTMPVTGANTAPPSASSIAEPAASAAIPPNAIKLCISDFDVGQRKIILAEQLGHFGGGQQGFGLGTAVVRGLGAQTLDSRLEPVEGGEVRVCGHGSVPNKTRPRDRLRAALNLGSISRFNLQPASRCNALSIGPGRIGRVFGSDRRDRQRALDA